jgi:hypothetical protein
MKKYILTIIVAVGFMIRPAAVNAQGYDQMEEALEQTMQALENLLGDMEGFEEGVAPAFEQFRDWMETVRSGVDLYNSMQALDNGECVPDFTTPAEAMMPSGCRSNEECAGCYEEPVRRLNVVRKSLARLRCIYTNTKRFTDAALSFGDNVSGIHGVTGLAWQSERRGIEQSWRNFEQTYDRKYTDLIASMQVALNGINQCEGRFGMRDWYQRFGILYLEIMKEKYKRSE